MITKAIFPDAFDFGMPTVGLIGSFSKGLDTCGLRKRAALFDDNISGLKLKPGHACLHVITTGAMETYGCFFEGQTVITKTGRKCIEDIDAGEQVLTHKNRFRPVVKTFCKLYDDAEALLYIQGMPEPQRSTVAHPFLCLRREKLVELRGPYYRHSVGKCTATYDRETFLEKLAEEPGEWIPASDIRPGDFVYVSCGIVEEPARELPDYLAPLLGYYLSEGCVVKRYSADRNDNGEFRGVVLILHKEVDAAVVEHIKELVSGQGHAVTPRRASANSEVALRIELSWKELAEQCVELCGRGSKKKFLHPVLFAQSREWRLKFLAAYLDGDGHITHSDNKYDNTIKFSTVSRGLAYDLQRLFASVGISVSVSKCHNRESNGCLGKGDLPIYAGSVCSSQVSAFVGITKRLAISHKTPQVGIHAPRAGSYVLPNGYMLMKVKAVVLEEQLGQEVYNLEVAEDNSYVVDIVGHNSNSNADGYPWEPRLHVAPCPEDGMHKSAMLAGGLKEYHNKTFEKLGAVYFDHRNKHTGAKPSGYIVKAALNDDMKRGELLIGVEVDKWSKELQKVANEEPIFFSLACDVPYDLCSYCLHKSASRDSYCQHLKNDMLSITSDGHQICAINDMPHLHDISRVLRPADKIAFGLRKVASSRIVGGAELAEILGLAPSIAAMDNVLGKKASDRRELLAKLAAIEKEIEAGTCASPLNASLMAFSPDSGFGQADDSCLSAMNRADVGQLLGALKDSVIILPANLFFKALMGDKFKDVAPIMPEVEDALPGVFGRVLESNGLSDFLSDGSYEPMPCRDRALKELVDGLAGSHSLADGPVQVRVIRASLRPSRRAALNKRASVVSPAADYLAREYARYAVAFAGGLPDNKLNLTVAQMHARLATE